MLTQEQMDFALRARQTMNAHGLDSWTFTWNNRKNSAGLCDFDKRQIAMSRFVFPIAGEKQNRDTLLHEIAHALAFIHDDCTNHGPVWKKWCVKIGAIPKTRVSVKDMQGEMIYKYYLIDARDACIVRTFHRYPRKNYSTYQRVGDNSSVGQLIIVTHKDLKKHQKKARRNMVNS